MNRLKHIRHLALDMDGTIYSGGTLFESTLPFLALIGELGIGHTFLTNNSSKSSKDYLARLRAFPAALDQIVADMRTGMTKGLMPTRAQNLASPTLWSAPGPSKWQSAQRGTARQSLGRSPIPTCLTPRVILPIRI